MDISNLDNGILRDIQLKAKTLLYELFPLHRSLTGPSNRDTLKALQRIVPSLDIQEVPSGSVAYDWCIPPEWQVKDAYIRIKDGPYICRLCDSNLHVVSYSISINTVVSRDELLRHLHWIDDKPEAIPYVTSYYHKYWGFCLPKNIIDCLPDTEYEVVIDSSHIHGSMTMGEIYIPGKSKRELVFSTYICHPSLANNELSGPILSILLAERLLALDNFYSYRFLFLPETIGSIYYISRNLDRLRSLAMGVFIVTCVGDSGTPSYLASRSGQNYADRLIQKLEHHLNLNFRKYSWLKRGSDERQFGAPTVDLPVASLMRTKYGEYPEYHTSLDNLDLVKPEYILDTLRLYLKLVQINESSRFYISNHMCEPMLSKRNLYPSLSDLSTQSDVTDILNILSYTDGYYSDVDISGCMKVPLSLVRSYIDRLERNNIITNVSMDPLPRRS